ncbi:hypothetical protein BC832DRAFT_278593 [Gaertneriomyces semiglobifer]|nr:hypothetical protein BC832DRAFT_278593 [Gaertneriomyces semiglobifer]
MSTTVPFASQLPHLGEPDIFLKAGPETVGVHSSILLPKALALGKSHPHAQFIELPNISPQTLHSLLNYVYTGAYVPPAPTEGLDPPRPESTTSSSPSTPLMYSVCTPATPLTTPARLLEAYALAQSLETEDYKLKVAKDIVSRTNAQTVWEFLAGCDQLGQTCDSVRSMCEAFIAKHGLTPASHLDGEKPTERKIKERRVKRVRQDHAEE